MHHTIDIQGLTTLAPTAEEIGSSPPQVREMSMAGFNVRKDTLMAVAAASMAPPTT
jgi:hypothetical protein